MTPVILVERFLGVEDLLQLMGFLHTSRALNGHNPGANVNLH